MSPDPKKKKKRALTAWQKHVKATMAKYPGLSFKEALPKAKLTYKKDPCPPRSGNPVSPVPKKRGGRKMAKKKGRKRASFTLPIAPVAGIASGFLLAPSGWASPVEAAMAGDAKRFSDAIMANWLCYDSPSGKFDFVNKGIGIKLTLVGCLIHWVAGKFGVNRFLARSKIPVVRV